MTVYRIRVFKTRNALNYA